MSSSSPSSSGSVSRRRPSPPGKSVAATSWKWSRTARERLLEAALDGLGELVAQALELLQALLEVGALVAELGEPLLLALVLLLRERVDAAERLAAALEALELLGQLLGIVALGRLGAGLLDPALELLRLGRERRELDVDRRRTLTGLGRRPSQLGLLRAELAQLLAELPRPLAARVGAGAEARLEAGRDLDRFGEDRRQPLGRLGRARIGRGGAWDVACSAAASSSSISASSARRRASSSSSTASAASPAYQSSPRCGS